MARLRPLALCIGLALFASGCAGAGGQSKASAATLAGHRFSGEQGRVAAVIGDYQAAMRAGDTRRLCDRILFLESPHGTPRAQRLRRCVASGDLAQEIKDNQGKDRYSAVEGVRINGLQAVATVSVSVPGGAQGRTEPFYLKRRVGGWRIAARGLTPAHTDFRVFGRLDCRRVVGVADAQRAVRAVSAMAFLEAFVPRPRRGAPMSLALVGVDFRNAARAFHYRTPAGKVVPRYVVDGTDPYSIGEHSFCATSTGSFP